MGKSYKEKAFAIGGAVVGLMMGGSAFAATQSSLGHSGKYFQFNELSSGYQVTSNKDDKEDSCGEGACGEGSCGSKDDKKKETK